MRCNIPKEYVLMNTRQGYLYRLLFLPETNIYKFTEISISKYTRASTVQLFTK
jgi:hypothetical protein